MAKDINGFSEPRKCPFNQANIPFGELTETIAPAVRCWTLKNFGTKRNDHLAWSWDLTP